MTTNKKQSSKKMTKLAVDILHDDNSSQIQRRLAGSVLSQTNTSNQTSAEMEELAGRALQSPKYNENTLSLAASVISQSNKKR